MKGVFIMSYEKQTWVTGETITASKLNHMENGIEELSKEYDFILYYNRNAAAQVPITASALGISPDDLFDKITENEFIKTICVATISSAQGDVFYISSDYITYTTVDDIKMLRFKYNDLDDSGVIDIAITDSDVAICTYQSEIIRGGYTYSNGEYEFSFDTEPPQ